MKKALKVVGIIAIVIILFIAGAAFYVKNFLPDVGPAPEMKISSTPEKVKRGEYLANHVMICMDCHSERDWRYFAGPMQMDSLGKGGEVFDKRAGFPGTIYSANITPAGIGDWTDGEVFRAITTGVRKNGKAIFPVMPHHNYGQLDPEDIESVICYLRSLKPLEYKVPESEYEFPMNFIVNTIPQKANFSKRPDTSDVIAYGKYIATAASCKDCHTPFDKGKFDTAFLLAGGRSFQLPAGTITSMNLTPDPQTGIGNMTKEQFLDKFRPYRDSAYAHRQVDFMSEYSSIMPWSVYAGMSDQDLGAIYEFLRTLKPIENKVVKWQPNEVARK
jgi:hypothetical protein